jgi:hypothetical protein
MVYNFELGSIFLVFKGTNCVFRYTQVSTNMSHIRPDIRPCVNYRGRISGPTHDCSWINHVYVRKMAKNKFLTQKLIWFLQDGVGVEGERA